MTKSDKSGSPGDSQTKQILKKAEADDTESKKSAFLLRLYIAGATPQSTRAVGNIKKICEEHLNGSYQLEVIDLYQQPQLAAGEQIIAVPTLIKKQPLPLRVIIGDLSDTERVLAGLDLQ